jgi:hypothetical protein
VPDDRLAAATAELYGSAPETFTERRDELAAAARGAGDRAAAKAIAALRRPTRAAWVVNRLARTDPGAAPKLAELASALRAAQEARHGPRLRELSAARGALVDALTAQALDAAGVPEPPPSLRLEVSQTLTAALADPGVAADFSAGTLTRAAQWSGFGMPPAETVPDEEAEPAAENAGAAGGARHGGTAAPGAAGEEARRPRAGGSSPRPGAARRGRRSGDAAGGQAAQAEPAAPASAASGRRRAEEEEWLAREAAERAARRREQYEEAERMVAVASAAAAAAVSAEDRLEAEVRDLEQRLTQARTDLTAARMRARHAEAAERRARQALERLPSG